MLDPTLQDFIIVVRIIQMVVQVIFHKIIEKQYLNKFKNYLDVT